MDIVLSIDITQGCLVSPTSVCVCECAVHRLYPARWSQGPACRRSSCHPCQQLGGNSNHGDVHHSPCCPQVRPGQIQGQPDLLLCLLYKEIVLLGSTAEDHMHCCNSHLQALPSLLLRRQRGKLRDVCLYCSNMGFLARNNFCDATDACSEL